MDREALQRELNLNYEFFETQANRLLPEHKGEYVLIKQQEFIDYFDDLEEAEAQAKQKFPDGIYSIQQIGAPIIDLGIYSYA